MKSKAVYGVILLVLWVLYLLFVIPKTETNTYDNMNTDERIRTEQSIAPGW